MINKPSLKIVIASESAVYVYLSDKACPTQSQVLQSLCHALKLKLGNAIVDITVSYTSLLVTYDVFSLDVYTLKNEIYDLADNFKSGTHSAPEIELPVYYHPDVAPDLTRLASEKKLSQPELIKLHSGQTYTVFAIGFAPGFAFLGEVDQRLATPRLATPRKQVAKGALGIADRQTAVYPAASPGGWNIIGNCPIALFNPSISPEMPFEIGSLVTFHPIERSEFLNLGGIL